LAVVYLGLGSNIDAEANLQLGARELKRRFDVIDTSPVYRCRAVGFEGDDFLNAAMSIQTDLGARQICEALEEIHDLAGRERGGDSYAPRTLDIDLLLYDDAVIDEPPVLVPRPDVLEYGFALGPLADIAPDYRHPLSGRTLAEHWADFDRSQHPIRRVELAL